MQQQKELQKTSTVSFKKIDIQNWKRKTQYLTYLDIIPCTFSMTVNMDITKFLPIVKSNKYKLFPTILHILSSVVNTHKEFRMGHDEQGNLGYYDILHPSFTIFHEKTETFTNVWTEYSENYTAFVKNYTLDLEKYKYTHDKSKPQEGGNFFNVSCIPWVNFTGFNLNLQKGYNYFSPIFTIGKYSTSGGKTLLPLAVQMHHAVCDGFHVAKCINDFQKKLDEFMPKCTA